MGVVLDGFDGDSVVSHGWGYLHELAIAGRWWKLATVSLPFSYRRGTPPIADYRSLVRFGRARRRADNGGATAVPPLPTGIPIAPGFVSRYADRVEPREVRSREREIHGRHLHSGTLLEVLGWLDHERLSAVYKRARAVVMPSRWQEPFGIAGLEALTMGAPVVAWDSGGVSEWHPGEGLVPWGDVAALALALREAAGRRAAAPPGFERSALMDRLTDVYEKVLVA